MNEHRTAKRGVPPSVKRTDWAGWLRLAAVEGAALGCAALAVLWRDLPWLPAPAGALSEHALFWAKLAAHEASPALFAQSARTYAAHWSAIGADGRLAIEWRAAVASLAACAPVALTARRALTPRDGLVFLRGPSRHEGEAAVRRLRAKFRKQAKRWPDHPIAPGVPWPASMWTRHTLLVGGTGAGKSTFIKPLIERVVAAGEPMLLFDPKGDFTSAFEQPAILAPWDSRSLAWDVARDVRNILDMRRFAAAMVRESSDPMWSNASRQLLVGLLAYLHGTKKYDWGWQDLSELVALSQPELLAIMRLWHPEAVRAVERASVTTQGILINLSAFCSSIIDLARAWGDLPADRRVSFRQWTKGRERRHRQIILQGNGAYSELTKSYVEAIVGVIAAVVNGVEMDDDPKRKLWFIADEFPKMGKIPVRDLFEVGRSRGVRCVIACQDFAQIEEIHGEPFVRALMGMCATHVVGQISPGATAENICRALGAREHERLNVSSSNGGPKGAETLSFSRESVPLYSPSELASRLGPTDDGAGVKLLLATGGDAYELFYPAAQLGAVRPAHMSAPWTRGETLEPKTESANRSAPSDFAAAGVDSASDDSDASFAAAGIARDGCLDPVIVKFLADASTRSGLADDGEESASLMR